MLRPQDTSTRERKNLNGLWQFALDPDGQGRSDALVRRSAGRRAGDGRAGQLQRHRRRRGGARLLRRRLVPAHGLGAARLGRPADRAALRVRDPPRHGLGERRRGGLPRGRLHPVRGRHHRPRHARARRRGSPRWSTTPCTSSPSRRASSRTPPPASGSATGTTSSTTPASTAPSGCTPPTPPTSPTSPSSPIWTAPTASSTTPPRPTSADGAETRVVLRDAERQRVADRHRSQPARSTVPNVHRWAPGDGYLYDLELQLVDGDTVVDSYHQSVGVRTVQVDGIRFLINGEPFYFTGFGKHEDMPVIGKGHNDAFLLHDFELLKWIGANSFRTSHYPYSEDVLDYADRQGIVLIDETAAVGLNMGLGGGIFGGQGYTTFSPETVNDATQEVHAQAIRELIARDKNHPSVVLWTIANEPESETEGAENYFRPLFDVAREADPTRPVGFVNVMLAPHGKCRVSQFGDVLMLNRYYGWYVHTGDLEAAELAWEEELTALGQRGQADHHHRVRRRHLSRPALGRRRSPGREEYQIDYLDMNHRVFDRIDAVVGEQVWNFADFTTTSGIMRVGGNKKGVFTRDRQPKAARTPCAAAGARTSDRCIVSQTQ